MQTPISSNYREAAFGSSTPVFHAYLYRDGNLLYELPLEDGEVSYDLFADVQAEATLVVADASGTLVPRSIYDDLTPFGAEINITAGFKFGNTEEVVSLGWFVIQDMEIDEAVNWYAKGAPDGNDKFYRDAAGGRTIVSRGARITLKLRDRAQKLIDYKFLSPERTRETDVWAEIVRLTRGIVPTFDPLFTPVAIGYPYNYGDDRWEAIKGLAAAHAAEPVFTPNGELTLRKLKNNISYGDYYDWRSLQPLNWKGNLIDYKRGYSREDAYNIVVARGKTSQGADMVAYATVDSGPTAWNGPFGPRPIFYNDTKISDRTALQAFADAKLSTVALSNSKTIPVTALPSYAIMVGDYIDLVPPHSEANVNEQYTLPTQDQINKLFCRIVKLKHSAKAPMQAELAVLGEGLNGEYKYWQGIYNG